MKKLSLIILSLIFIFAFVSCANEKAPDDEPIESATQEENETISPVTESETDSSYIEKNNKTLIVKLNLESVEEIQISHLISSDVDKPTQKFIRDKKTIEKIIELINNTKFNVCENQDEIRKPGTTLIVKIDDKIAMSFQMDLVINGTYCEEPGNFSNDILNLFNDAPEEAEPIK